MDHEGCLHFQLWIEHQENKIRTIVTERIEAAKMAKQADWGVMTSHHRSVDQVNVLITGLN
ncbi:hypothetical protein CY35_18G100300 [Sphagnum magellanicum]|nr:hypothetical protein CY35_18G100300 [Sphagnum magellanicum]